MNDETRNYRLGLIYALLAFGSWGLGPIYFKAVAEAAPLEVLSHRVVWSFLFLAILIAGRGNLPRQLALLHDWRRMGWLALTAALVGANWLTFIWAVANNQIVEAALGYFIHPLFNVLLAMLFLGERMRPVQWLAVGLATLGVLNQVWMVGYLPWVALSLMLTFGFYGLIRKKIAVDPVQGLAVETLLLTPFAIAYLVWLDGAGALVFGSAGAGLDLLLIAAGLVTALPLVWFAEAANRLHLTLVGLLAYIAPSMTFLLAVFLYHEPFDQRQLFTFLLIWAGLALFSGEGWLSRRRSRLCRDSA